MLRKHHSALRTGFQASNVLQTLRLLLTDTEYFRVSEEKGDIERVDQLIEILLAKDSASFDVLCSALEANGYPHWASMLRAESKFMIWVILQDVLFCRAMAAS